MKKKRQPVEQPARPDGWYWVRYFVPLRGGHWHYEWLPARVEHSRVQLWGSNCTIPLTAPVLHNALWRGPIEPPPLDEPPRTALALDKSGTRQNRQNRREAAVDLTDAERHAMRLRLLAADITDLLFESGREVRAGKVRLAELVDRVEQMLEEEFGGEAT